MTDREAQARSFGSEIGGRHTGYMTAAPGAGQPMSMPAGQAPGLATQSVNTSQGLAPA